jgi:imidazolonepropionase-like amidohydrolase
LPRGSAEVGLVISHARVVDGTGKVIEQGAVVVQDGKIVSVGETPSPLPGALEIDAGGLTVMPGFIDSHRHIIRGDPAQWMAEQAAPQMQDALDAGITTVMSCGDPLPQILELRQQLAQGQIQGPRLLVAGWIMLARPAGPPPTVDPARAESSWAPRVTAQGIPAEETIAAMQQLKEAGVDAVKNVLMVTPNGPELETLKLIVAQGKQLGLPVITHAVTVQDTLAAVEAGVTILVHTPVDGDMSAAQAQTIGQAGIPMMSTLGVFVPFFSADNEALFRDGTPFPWERLYHAGEGAVNARLLWNAGITYGFGTDLPYGVVPHRQHRDLLAHEIRSLSLTFSPQDIVTIMTRNSGATVNRATEIGTLEPGKLGDIVLIEGDPLVNSQALLNVKMVIKGGRIVVDKR